MAINSRKETGKELSFSHFTLENIHENIFWIDDKGKIIRVNKASCMTTGYTREELESMHVFDLNKTEIPKNWKEHWKNLKREKILVFESIHTHKNGNTYPVEITNNLIIYEGKEYSCSLVRDLTKAKQDDRLIQLITEGLAGVIGLDFFCTLTKYVTAVLNVRFSLISECANAEKTKVRTISFCENNEPIENIEYDLSGTPCEIVMKGKDYFCERNLEKLFPKEKNIQSYMAVPIYSPKTGEVLGHIAALDRKPLTKDQNFNHILRIFATRAGAEIERKNADEKLKSANEKLVMQMKEIEFLKNKLQAENAYLQEEIKVTHNFDEIVTKSKNFGKILHQVEQVASTDSTVLILGESGTGKELLCRAIHSISRRSNRPLVKVNCAALPANLFESELFGHEKGAFTGATERKIGRFELADGGTIFLDELGELPYDLQPKLLRVLQEGEFERLGNPKTFKVNVRIIAATNRNLEKEIAKNNFREDLFYRLNVFPIESIPLRQRKEDIPLLVKHFCKKYEGKIGKRINHIPKTVIDALMNYDFPGNIRELENIIERALIITKGDTLQLGDWVSKRQVAEKPGFVVLNDVEKNHIYEVLKKTNWKVSGERGAAKLLGLKPTTLEARMKKLGIKRE